MLRFDEPDHTDLTLGGSSCTLSAAELVWREIMDASSFEVNKSTEKRGDGTGVAASVESTVAVAITSPLAGLKPRRVMGDGVRGRAS